MDEDLLDEIGFGASFTPDDRKKRTKLMADLYIFLEDSFDDIKTWTDNNEVADQIAHNTIRMLFPHFNFTEILICVENVLMTIRVPITEDMRHSFVKLVEEKAEHAMKNYRDRDNPFTNFKYDL